MTALDSPPVPAPVPAAVAADRSGLGHQALRWTPRLLVLMALAYLVLVRMPNDQTFAPFAQDAAIYGIVGLSLNILLGYTGQLSLGHNGFYGIGAFAAAYSLTVKGVPFGLTFVIAGLAGAVFALIMGVVALRITGLYLALITLVFGLTLEDSLFQVAWLTNEGAGQQANRPEWLFDETRYFYFCLAFLAVALYLDWVLLRSKTGRALLALKENERVAEAFGINVTAFKLLAFVLSGALCGIAGGLFAFRVGLVVGSGFGFALALTFVLMTVVGGLGSRLGVVMGATLFATLDYVLHSTWVHHINGFVFRTDNLDQFAVGFIGALGLILTLVQYPGGIGQQVRPITRWLSGHPFSIHDDKDAGPAAVEGSSVRA
ncbi:MAG: amino acid/amide transporter rane protein 2, family [Frankiales bacterium]|nr:amino acid/amide transporter rane protein 2, family [Frankiales bacterium]